MISGLHSALLSESNSEEVPWIHDRKCIFIRISAFHSNSTHFDCDSFRIVGVISRNVFVIAKEMQEKTFRGHAWETFSHSLDNFFMSVVIEM